MLYFNCSKTLSIKYLINKIAEGAPTVAPTTAVPTTQGKTDAPATQGNTLSIDNK